jgi:phenylalanine ammonia-lyase
MTVVIDGRTLGIRDIRAVARGARVELTQDAEILDRVARSRRVIMDAVGRGEQVYGVTTLFGGMADRHVRSDQYAELQRIALWHHKAATGPRLPAEDVRAAMLLRANSLIKGASGIRVEIIERLVTFLNAGAHPHVFQRGSIGASGDLTPFSYIAGAVVGLAAGYPVEFEGQELDCLEVLPRLGLEPVVLQPKEGLALNNGTGVSTGVAANALARAVDLTGLALEIHALYAQALLGTDQSFDPYIHAVKPHPGQAWTADRMRRLLAGSTSIRSEASGRRPEAGQLIQDRYGLRCLPQFVGPIVDALAVAAGQLTIEANSANDNPLINPDSAEILHTGNFLAQYTAVAMDSTRFHLGQLAKHLDSQIAMLVSPEFNHGLSPSLVGNEAAGINLGLKSLAIHGNQMSPLLGFYGQSVADRFPTHAEQYNQNINSQAMNAANLARESLDVLEHFLSVALVLGVQAVELRSRLLAGTYDAREVISPATVPLYVASRTAAAGPPDAGRPLHWNDTDGFIQTLVEGVLDGVTGHGAVLEAAGETIAALQEFTRL